MAGGTPPGGTSFAGGDLDEQTRQLVRLIQEVRPQVVVTYDERGGYGHPDHIRAHDVTVAAVEASSPQWTVAKLYAAVVPVTTLASLATLLAGATFEGPNPFAGAADAVAAGAPPDALPFGVAPERITAPGYAAGRAGQRRRVSGGGSGHAGSAR